MERITIIKPKIRNHEMMNRQMMDIEYGNSQIMYDLKKDIEELKLKKSSIKEIGIKDNLRTQNRAIEQKSTFVKIEEK